MHPLNTVLVVISLGVAVHGFLFQDLLDFVTGLFDCIDEYDKDGSTNSTEELDDYYIF